MIFFRIVLIVIVCFFVNFTAINANADTASFENMKAEILALQSNFDKETQKNLEMIPLEKGHTDQEIADQYDNVVALAKQMKNMEDKITKSNLENFDKLKLMAMIKNKKSTRKALNFRNEFLRLSKERMKQKVRKLKAIYEG